MSRAHRQHNYERAEARHSYAVRPKVSPQAKAQAVVIGSSQHAAKVTHGKQLRPWSRSDVIIGRPIQHDYLEKHSRKKVVVVLLPAALAFADVVFSIFSSIFSICFVPQP